MAKVKLVCKVCDASFLSGEGMWRGDEIKLCSKCCDQFFTRHDSLIMVLNRTTNKDAIDWIRSEKIKRAVNVWNEQNNG